MYGIYLPLHLPYKINQMLANYTSPVETMDRAVCVAHGNTVSWSVPYCHLRQYVDTMASKLSTQRSGALATCGSQPKNWGFVFFGSRIIPFSKWLNDLGDGAPK